MTPTPSKSASERAALVREARERAEAIRQHWVRGTAVSAEVRISDAYAFDRLADALEAADADAQRLDWLDEQQEPIVGCDQYGEPELQGYAWGVRGQCSTVRIAIDAARAAEETGR